MKNILITGHNGFIGSHLAKSLDKINQIYVLKEKRKSIYKELKISRSFENLSKYLKILKKINIIYLVGSNTSLNFSEDYPLESFKANILPILNLLNFLKKNKLKPKIVFLSSVSLYKSSKTSIKINSKIEINSIYDLNKLYIENKLLFFSENYSIDVCILRLSNIYGPSNTIFKNDRGVINKIIQNAKKNKIISVYGKGNYFRDYVYIDDLVAALIKCLNNHKIYKQKKFIICSGKSIMLKDLFKLIAKKISEKYNFDIKINYKPIPKKFFKINTRSFKSNCKNFKKYTGWSVNYNILDGINKII